MPAPPPCSATAGRNEVCAGRVRSGVWRKVARRLMGKVCRVPVSWTQPLSEGVKREILRTAQEMKTGGSSRQIVCSSRCARLNSERSASAMPNADDDMLPRHLFCAGMLQTGNAP